MILAVLEGQPEYELPVSSANPWAVRAALAIQRLKEENDRLKKRASNLEADNAQQTARANAAEREHRQDREAYVAACQAFAIAIGFDEPAYEGKTIAGGWAGGAAAKALRQYNKLHALEAKLAPLLPWAGVLLSQTSDDESMVAVAGNPSSQMMRGFTRKDLRELVEVARRPA